MLSSYDKCNGREYEFQLLVFNSEIQKGIQGEDGNSQ